jgi:DNA-binding winged helix-turn-helix (wHTH) protein
MLSFGTFSFDPEQQLLSKDGVHVALTSKQAALLKLLTGDPGTVHSKDAILDAVWGGRAVSEQVVFQNISALRALFGQHAIRTYPKRGYQWTVEVVTLSADQHGPLIRREYANSAPRKAAAVVAALCTLLVFAVGGFFLAQPKDEAPRTALHTLPPDTGPDGGNRIVAAAAASALGAQGTVVGGTTTAAFMSSPYMVWKNAGLSGNDLLVAGVLRRAGTQAGDHIVLDYIVQGERRRWHAYIEAQDAGAISAKLATQLRMIAASRYFSLREENAVTAELALLHAQMPDDATVLAYLTEQALEEENLDVAGGYADRLMAVAANSRSPVYEAVAYQLKGRRALMLGDVAAAYQQVAGAANVAARHNLPFLLSEILKTEAEIAYAERDFAAIKRLLREAAALSRQADEPVREVRAHTLMSIMASKLGFTAEALEYLHQARRLLADAALDGSHYMLVDYHFALFSPELVEREQWLRAALARPVTPENAWVLGSAAEQLVSLLLAQGRADAAMDVAGKVQQSETVHRLRATIHLAAGEVDAASKQAQHAFNLARINGNKWIAMPMALLLLELDTAGADAAEYRRYLTANRKGRWATWQKERLDALGL